MTRGATLSVCIQTNAPAARIAALLEPLRSVASEVVVAVDARVAPHEVARLAGVVDVVRRIEFAYPERHLQWLHAQCSGDWILLLDSDEVVSAALARRLPELLADEGVRQYVTPRHWLHPDARSWLDELPWSADWITRLVRNEPALRFPGIQHLQADAVLPRAFIEEPIYHLDLLLRDEALRRAKAIAYEVRRPAMTARGGGRFNEAFYLPELREHVSLRPVPEEDRARIATLLDPPPLEHTHAPPQPAAVLPLSEIDRHWELRPVGEDAYAATLEPLEPVARTLPGEHVELLVRVRNDGDATWPWSLEHEPEIRLGHRWLDASGGQAGAEGARSPFPKRVAPGEQLLAPVAVLAPVELGRHVLEIDVVHDGVRWFGAACRIEVEVAPLSALPPVGERLRPTAAAPTNGAEPVREPAPGGEPAIPRVLHRIWLGDTPMPPEHEAFGAGFAALHPGWETRLWTDADLDELAIDVAARAAARSKSELSNLVRYELLARHGGVYADTDVEFLKPLDGLLASVHAFAALELPGRLGTAILGCVPGHPLFARAAREARDTVGTGAGSTDANGPLFFSLLAEQEGGLTIFGPEIFYPYVWTELERRDEDFPDAYAVHHWAQSWSAELGGGA